MLYILAIYLAMSLVTFAAYGLDKRRAIKGTWRIKEATLHLLALLGGVPGALLGARVFRHKTRKVRFRVVTFAILSLHLAGWVLYFLWRSGRLG
jgi:uncharacterized membrane protein YsdA (DUF1294 family)